ncbi:hypothetical protein N1032_27500, partial [Herbiconiux sp. CPCC 203386]|nr:hypothetical protein [Herbiconiux daphne]
MSEGNHSPKAPKSHEGHFNGSNRNKGYTSSLKHGWLWWHIHQPVHHSGGKADTYKLDWAQIILMS